jgi:hypothetical protein
VETRPWHNKCQWFKSARTSPGSSQS